MSVDFMVSIGDSASVSKTISESDVYMFAGLTGDFNPAHVNADYAKNSIFGERIAHGILITGLISAALGMKMPGEGTIYLEQNAKFVLPVKIGDTVKAVVTVSEIINDKKRIVRLSTDAFNQNGDKVVEGYAVVKAP